MKTTILGNGTVVSRAEENRFLKDGAVVYSEKEILDVGKTGEMKRRYPDSEYIDAKGGYIMPAFINPHEHCYSAMSRGILMKKYAPRYFMENLEQKWWNLDRNLTEKQIRLGAQVFFIDAAKNGVATEFEHHVSYGCITGSLSLIADAAREVGIRICPCFEVSDRWGEECAREAVAENERWRREAKRSGSDMVSSTLGLHASFTLSDRTMEYIREHYPVEEGCHIHIAECAEDEEDCRAKYGMSIVERLKKWGMLGPKTIIAHGVHLSDEEMELIREANAMVVTNPESNMNNAVGCPPALKLVEKGIVTGLGMDGFSHDMFLSWRMAGALFRHDSRDINAAWAELPKMIFEGNSEIGRRYFRKIPGRIEKKAAPDLIVAEYDSPTPVTEENIDSHMMFGMNGSNVRLTVCGGRVIAKDGRVTGADEEKILYESRKEAEKLWGFFADALEES